MVAYVAWRRWSETQFWTFYSSDGEILAQGKVGEANFVRWPQKVPWRKEVEGKTGVVRIATRRGKPVESIEYRNGMQDGAYIMWNNDLGVCVFKWYQQGEPDGLYIRLINEGILVRWDDKEEEWTGKGFKVRGN